MECKFMRVKLVANAAIGGGKCNFMGQNGILHLGTKSYKILDGVIWVGFRTTMKLTQLLDLAWDIMKYWIILIKHLLLLYLMSDI